VNDVTECSIAVHQVLNVTVLDATTKASSRVRTGFTESVWY